MTKIDFREVTRPTPNPAHDSRTKDIAKHGVRTMSAFMPGVRFSHVVLPKAERVSIITDLSEIASDDKGVIAALLANSEIATPNDFREAVMSKSQYSYTDYGEDVVNYLLSLGKINMEDLLEAVETVLAEV